MPAIWECVCVCVWGGGGAELAVPETLINYILQLITFLSAGDKHLKLRDQTREWNSDNSSKHKVLPLQNL